MKCNPLSVYGKNIHSQFGEDGILEKVLELIPEKNGWCVEFGAWDGIYMSNTKHLVDTKEYKCIYIEGDTKRCESLRKNIPDRCKAINAYVGWEPDDSLDFILSQTQIPTDFDVLSIDIDGNDYHTWAATNNYRPKIVVIEYNPTMSISLNYFQPADNNLNIGSSLSALVQLGKRKSYDLIAITAGNAIFAAKEYALKFNVIDLQSDEASIDQSAVTHFFVGYDGSLHLVGKSTLPWHGLQIDPRKIQILPKFLRKYPGTYTWAEKILIRIWRVTMGIKKIPWTTDNTRGGG